MANTIEYIFSLQDKMSAKIGNITVTSDRMLGKFADLEKKTMSVNKTFNETGRTLGSLRERIALLQAEREWIPAENIEGIPGIQPGDEEAEQRDYQIGISERWQVQEVGQGGFRGHAGQ